MPPSSPRPSDSHSKSFAMTLTAAFLGWLLDGFEIGLFPVVARPALQDMLGSAGEGEVGLWMGRITAAFLVGAALGGALFGWLGDRVGRVRAMSWSVLCYSLFSAAGFWASAPHHLAWVRFIAALGMGGEWALGVALVMESWPDRFRPWLAAAIGAASNLGMLLVGALAKHFPVTPDSWRWLFLVGAAPAGLTLFIRMFVPESTRWKRAAESAAHPPMQLAQIFRPPLLRVTLLGVCLSSVALIGTWGSVQWIPSWADQITGGKIPTAKADVQMISSLMAAVGAILGPVLLSRIKRRTAYAILCASSLAACVWLFRFPSPWGPVFLIKTGITAFTTAAFYGFFPLYFPELFPTITRATGQGICYNSGRIVAAAGAVLSGQLVSFLGGYAQMGATISLIYGAGILLALTAPETHGKPLPE